MKYYFISIISTYLRKKMVKTEKKEVQYLQKQQKC